MISVEREGENKEGFGKPRGEIQLGCKLKCGGHYRGGIGRVGGRRKREVIWGYMYTYS